MKKQYGKKMVKSSGKNHGQVNGNGTKSWDGKKQMRSSKNKGFGSC